MTSAGSLRGGVMLAATGMAWGGMFPVIKQLLPHLDPVSLTLLRFGLSIPVLVLLPMVVEGRKALSTGGRMLQLWWLGTLGFAGFGLLLVLGVQSTRPEHAAVVPALMPLIAVVVTALRERTRPQVPALAAIALAALGVLLVVSRGDPAQLLQVGTGRGEILVLLGAVCWVLYTLGAGRFPGWSGLRYTTLTLGFGTITILAVELVALATGLARWPAMSAIPELAPAMGYLVLVASVMGFLFWNAGMAAIGPKRGVLFINLVPVTAFAVALLKGHVPNMAEIMGVACVIAALGINSVSRPRTRSDRVRG